MNMVGSWNLQVATPFGTHPATLVFEGTGGALNGRINSRLGDAPLENLSVTHDSFEATVALEVQGRPYQANINGRIENDLINGTIKVKLPIAPPIKYTGTRAA
jgi:hypothetical protein